VSVEEKPEGGTGLKLDAIPDENARPKPKPATRSGGGGQKRAGSRKKPPRGGGLVPRVPLKME
jgi:ATP-dependent Clp protease ATP-binding subunit ClpA